MRSVPTQRPENFGTRTTLTPEEFQQRASRDEGGKDLAANRETFLRNEWGIRTFGYSSLVVDPANGRVPEMTPAGRARAANRDRGTFGPGPFNAFEDFTLYDRCITRGVLGSTLPVIYGNGMRIIQNPDVGGDQLRNDPRHAHHPARPPAASRRRASVNGWVTREATGKATRSSSRRAISPIRPASAATATAPATVRP